jgi:antitoxin (DNA-binding transcriptional repressor) of toxin-antitoxin stability system
MKEINFKEFKVKCSAILQQVGKTRQAVRVTHLGEPLVEVIPLHQSAEKSRKRSSRESSASNPKADLRR